MGSEKAFQPVVFMEVLSWGDRGFITDWYEKELALEAQEEFDGLLILLEATPPAQWCRPDFSPLEGGICELLFYANQRQYRPLGWFGPGSNQFTILIGAYKKMKTWTPADARQTAKKRRKEVLEGVRKIRRYDQYRF